MSQSQQPQARCATCPAWKEDAIPAPGYGECRAVPPMTAKPPEVGGVVRIGAFFRMHEGEFCMAHPDNAGLMNPAASTPAQAQAQATPTATNRGKGR